MTPDEPEVSERGLQVERTELAWVRTALACAALATISSRLEGGSGSRSVVVAACVGGAVGAMGVAAAVLRIATLRGRTPAPPPPRRATALLAASVVAADLVALALLFL